MILRVILSHQHLTTNEAKFETSTYWWSPFGWVGGVEIGGSKPTRKFEFHIASYYIIFLCFELSWRCLDIVSWASEKYWYFARLNPGRTSRLAELGICSILYTYGSFLKWGYPHIIRFNRILIGFSIINRPAIGIPPILGDLHMSVFQFPSVQLTAIHFNLQAKDMTLRRKQLTWKCMSY